VDTASVDSNKTTAAGEASVALGNGADGTAIVTGNDNQTNIVNIRIFLLSVDNSTNNLPLAEILDRIGSENIQRTYQKLPIDSHLWEKQGVDLNTDQIISSLQDLRILPQFVNYLADDDQIPVDIRDDLQQLFPRSLSVSDQESPLAQSKVSIDPKSTLGQYLESYLLIAIRSTSMPNKFSVDAWLIKDHKVQSDSQRLDIETSLPGTFYELAEIAELLTDFLQMGLRHLAGIVHNLVIEVFLPIEHLCTGVDQWKILDFDESIPIGTRYKIVIRSSDRLNEQYRIHRWSDWCKNWQRVKDFGDTKPACDDFEHLNNFNNCNWKKLKNDLSQKIGLKLTCGLIQEHKQDLFKAIHLAATPIAIWVRCDLPHLNLETEINDLIGNSPLFKLSDAVRTKRQQADEEDQSHEHFGAHLAMLWEDPERLTPDAWAPLLPPGQ
jgi:vWA-MoxR associated protein C-terminal domain